MAGGTMRQVSFEMLKERKNKILNMIIHYYIKTGKPVGSNVLIEKYNIALSSATVRNLMAELEEEGFLTHPHTSAGRIPTDKGYRTYVDTLKKIQTFAIKEEKKICEEYENNKNEIESILSETSRMLSELSHCTGFITAPQTRVDKIKNIELVRIFENEFLVIILTQSGIVKHKKIAAVLSNKEAAELRDFLNEKLREVSIAAVNETIVDEIKKFRAEKDKILEIAEKISDMFYNIQDDIYVDGTENVMNVEDFNDFEPVKSLIQFNENKKKFIEVINKNFDIDGINVKIGSENVIDEFKSLSLVTTVYKQGGTSVGVLGIIGPKRMEYKKMMALVRTVSQIVNGIFNKK
jgi:heat-inducible transcriptional repressor